MQRIIITGGTGLIGLPLGITVRTHISVVALGAAACRVTVG